MSVERRVFDSIVCQIGCVEGVHGLTIIAHAFGSVSTHPISTSRNLTIQLIQPVVQSRLLYGLPGLRDSFGFGIDREVLCGQDRLAVESGRSHGGGNFAVGIIFGFVLVAEEYQIAMPVNHPVSSASQASVLCANSDDGVLETDLTDLKLNNIT